MRILIALLFSNFVFSQSEIIEVVYNNQVINHFEKKENVSFQKAIEESNKVIHQFSLVTSSKVSEFKFIDKIDNNEHAEGEISISTAIPPSFKIYKELKKTYASFTAIEAMGERLILIDSLDFNAWKITRISQNIKGYKTYLATIDINPSKKVKAWFTKQIPIRSGPEKYQGLPGLILKIEIESYRNNKLSETNLYELDHIKKLEKYTFKKPNKGQIISEKHFIKMQKEAMNSLRN